ncbi:(2Fe-2S)-binding protein [Mycolicibacterium sp.]|uniref:(2Fe-2S)-binding protein n=1 Tax=Mycolicibacterium sp. TaxID=2320850 RepID=UPI003D0E7814
MTKRDISIQVNGRLVEATVEPNEPLIHFLRTRAGASDVKAGCGEGTCGTCTVLLDGELTNSCLVFAVQADGADIITVQSLGGGSEPLHPLQRAFVEHGGAQCGFCTPGMVLTALWHVNRNQNMSRSEIRDAIGGNLCRCTGYTKIVDAIEAYSAGVDND